MRQRRSRRLGKAQRAQHCDGLLGTLRFAQPTLLDTLPHGQEIVAYCRGPYCMLAFEAVAKLREAGYQARRLEDGFPEWKAESRPVENGSQQ